MASYSVWLLRQEEQTEPSESSLTKSGHFRHLVIFMTDGNSFHVVGTLKAEDHGPSCRQRLAVRPVARIAVAYLNEAPAAYRDNATCFGAVVRLQESIQASIYISEYSNCGTEKEVSWPDGLASTSAIVHNPHTPCAISSVFLNIMVKNRFDPAVSVDGDSLPLILLVRN